MESVRWSAVDELKKSAPKLQWNRYLSNNGSYITLRVDQKPFDDVRVRRALNMAVNKAEIVKTYYGGNAEMLNFPMHVDYIGYYEPLADMPESVRGAVRLQPRPRPRPCWPRPATPMASASRPRPVGHAWTTTCWRRWPPTWPRWA